MKVLLAIAVLIGAAAVATYVQYQSFDPCDWLIHDMAENSNLPHVGVEAKMRADFLLDGITDPNAEDCIVKWWKLRKEDPPSQS